MNNIESAAVHAADNLTPLEAHSEVSAPVVCPVTVALVGGGLVGAGAGYWAAQDGYVADEPDNVSMTDDVRDMSVADLLGARQHG